MVVHVFNPNTEGGVEIGRSLGLIGQKALTN